MTSRPRRRQNPGNSACPTIAKTIESTNRPDFVINLSANTIEQADRYKELGIAPVTLVLPEEAGSSFKTAGGNQVVICPASIIKGITCLDCQLCLKSDRKSIIGFPAHGSGKHRFKVR